MNALPSDLWVLILSRADLQSKLILRATCYGLSKLFFSASTWKQLTLPSTLSLYRTLLFKVLASSQYSIRKLVVDSVDHKTLEILQHTSETLKELRLLNSCSAVLNKSGIFEKPFRKLLRLDLHFFPPKLSTIASENDSLKPILGRLAVNCTHLTELHLLSDVALEFDDVFQLVSSCPGLRKLTLTPCLHWTTDQIRALVEAAPNLEYLALFQARLLDDTILDILSTLLPSLHTFIVHSCPLVTDAGLCRLANNCSPALTWIKVIRCPQLSLGILKDTKFSQESGCPMEYSSYPSGMGMGYCRTSL